MANAFVQKADEKLNDGQKLTMLEQHKLKQVRDKLGKLDKSHNRKYMSNSLQRFLKARFLKPQRVLNLSFVEEKARAESGWQDFDYKVALAAFGSEKQLSDYIVE